MHRRSPGVTLSDVQDVLDQLERSTTRLCTALAASHDLEAPSLLPGWSQLTIACHLRYGGEAFAWMTRDALAGVPTSYYPDGRSVQRPTTLVARPEESSTDVVASLRKVSDELHSEWQAVDNWDVRVTEPPENPDLGTMALRRLPLARLTEVEVHGTDLGLGLGPWSDVFVRHVLPMRLEWLSARRSNHKDVDTAIKTSWRLVAEDMDLSYVIAVDGPNVVSEPGDAAAATISGTGAELLALLLGRAPDGFAPAEFGRAFPGP